jgi:hypothetical protein
VEGISGWRIRRDGVSEFTGIIIRAGTISPNNFVQIGSQGIETRSRSFLDTPLDGDFRTIMDQDEFKVQKYSDPPGDWFDIYKLSPQGIEGGTVDGFSIISGYNNYKLQIGSGLADGFLRLFTNALQFLFETSVNFQQNAVFQSGAFFEGSVKVGPGAGGTQFREFAFGRSTISGNSSLIVYTFIGSINPVRSTAAVSENNSTNRNAPKVYSLVSGSNVNVIIWNTGTASRVIEWQTFQEA